MRLFSTPAAAIALGCLLLGGAPAWAAPKLIPVDGGQVSFETCGSGPKAIVLLHDGILDGSAFDAVWPKLCARFKIVRYDRRGYDASPPAAAPYDAVADLDAVMKAAGVQHATLVGSSSGGGVATDFALAHPRAVDGLILVGAAVNGFKPTEHFMKRTQTLVTLLSQGRLADAVKDPYILTPGAEAERAFVVADITAHPGNFGAAQMIKDGPEVMGRLGEIKVPTLIVTGEVDIPDVHAHAGALEALIPGARRVIVPNSGHFLYLEQPKAFTELITTFVDAEGR
ncbi:alpha/beta fold hydrolase [Caulobacter sp. UNC279MFTsu5.1]|uniref:alpha/beta fold hydrolase n=1 Tax=Caulobacter sp. UNC279MFTsu5.1 TaxID=1502775 RepID=UPI0008EB1F6F|nr:alpha/beta hydrolase [Caulobacter sp. UNC279MFTsu5.1]SFK73836.1 Pimeloyl-ACP methyl ester carboxylesterase [Caulobacter sp. UNC279MFTsu5.1]